MITRKQLMQDLKVKRSETVKGYEKRGMPVIYLSEREPRYDLMKVLNWFADQDTEGLPE